MLRSFSFLFLLLILLTAFAPSSGPDVREKIDGVSLVAPVHRIGAEWVPPVKQMNAGWVAILPYAYSYKGRPRVAYDMGQQWWGERKEGVRATIKHAKGNGVKVMLKPMVWIPGSWPGGYTLPSESEWKEWEKEYSNYILGLARIAQEEKVDLFCVGTEYKLAVKERADFWRRLIAQVRKVYSGKITYAANWDNFTEVSFWKDLDYLGIDAYFPLVDATVPSVEAMRRKWNGIAGGLERMKEVTGKQILFTEFGYRSIDRCAWNQWELENVPYNQRVNLQGQVNAYQAFFEALWQKDWFAGVFLWQWYSYDNRAGGMNNSDYTPQNKPAEKLIAKWFD